MPGGVRAANEAEAAKLEALKGREVICSIRQPRNLKFHRRFFAMLHAGLEMADTELGMEQWRALVTVGAGWCDFIEGKTGTIAIPRSISFARMDETEFTRLYDDCIRFICANYLNGTTPDELREAAAFLEFM